MNNRKGKQKAELAWDLVYSSEVKESGGMGTISSSCVTLEDKKEKLVKFTTAITKVKLK